MSVLGLRGLIFTAVMMILCLPARARQISPSTAKYVAEKFLFSRSGKHYDLVQADLPTSINNLYLFTNLNGELFVLVASDDCCYPILGYSLTSSISSLLSDDDVSWLQNYSAEISSAVRDGQRNTMETRTIWERYLNSGNKSIPNSSFSPILPLLTTNWRGGTYYNNLCPTGMSGSHLPAGCGAVAMAQVMKYYNWPSTGTGSNSYTLNDGTTLTVDFGSSTYDFDNMPDELSSLSSDIQINAIAKLMFHAGVSVNMKYNTGGSISDPLSNGTLEKKCVENALKTHFKYSKELHGVYQASYTDDEWSSILRQELVNSRPIIYRGAETNGNGHIWVCDGMDEDGLFHFNGGGGSTTGYFRVTAVPNHQFPKKCGAIIGIKPDYSSCSGECLVNAMPNNASYGTAMVCLKSNPDDTHAEHIYGCGDTIVLSAVATETSRFVRWSDGFIYNPREETVASEATYIAIFEQVSGDTLYYDNGCYIGIYGLNQNGNSAYWGIKLPPSVLIGHDSLKSVMLFAHYEGQYDLSVYNGETPEEENRLTSQDAYTTNEMEWTTIDLAEPVAIDVRKPVWIVMHPYSIGYSMPFAPNSGNTNGFKWSYNFSSWYNNIGNKKYNWMLRGIFSSAEPIEVEALSDNENEGSVTGGGTYLLGEDVLLTATAENCYVFTHWSDGDTINPRLITATENTTLTAFFEALTTTSIEEIEACDSLVWHDSTYTQSTTYPTYITQGASGCDSIVNLHLTINTAPEAIITGNTQIANGEATTLTASEGESYLWSNGMTTQYITVAPNEDTFYSVTITDNNGCTSTTETIVYVTTNTCSLYDEIKVFPNPTKGAVNIVANEIMYLKITNAIGQTLFENKTPCSNINIDLKNYGKGIYVMHIMANGKPLTQKLVVE